MRVALLGLAGSGKTTVFNAVVDHPVAAPAGALQTETHVALVRVADPRLERCGRIFAPEKLTPATFEVWDPPGLPPGSGARDGERRTRLLAGLREVDALVVVLRDFRTDRYAYERAEPDPAADLDRVTGDLVTADFVVVEGRRTRLQEGLARGSRTADQDRLELAVLDRVAACQEAGESLADLGLDAADAARVRGFQLFGLKPVLVLLNGPESRPEALRPSGPLAWRGVTALDAQLEADLAAMDPAERPAFREEFGIGEPAAERLVGEIHRAAGRISFFTVVGKEVRAWSLPEGGTALDAAACVHTDLARGFVRAEVYPFEDLDRAGGVRELRAKGAIRLEGKGYVVRDGDVVQIRSGV